MDTSDFIITRLLNIRRAETWVKLNVYFQNVSSTTTAVKISCEKCMMCLNTKDDRSGGGIDFWVIVTKKKLILLLLQIC